MTAVIPLYIYVNQVNNLYDATVVAMNRLDQERDMEYLEVYAFPYIIEEGVDEDQIKVYIKNRCSLDVRVMRVWISSDDGVRYETITTNGTIPPMEDYTYGPFNVTLPSGEETWEYVIEISTSRGNVFSSLTNPLRYTGTVGDSGEWSSSNILAINIVIEGHFFHSYKINVTGPDFSYINTILMGLGESAMDQVNVPDFGTYNVKVSKRFGWGSWNPPYKNENVTITPAEPSKWVYAPDPDS